MALSRKQVERIFANPTGRQSLHNHEDGLGLRESIKGKFTWQGRYSFEGQQKRLDYGTYPQISLAEAEDKHDETLALVREGIDPRAELIAASAPKTVSELCQRWLKLDAEKNRRRPELAREVIDANIAPPIGHIKLAILAKRHVHAITDPLVEKGSAGQAKKALGLFRQICNWAVERDYLTTNPTAGINKSRLGGKTEPRTRALDDEELAAVWSIIGGLGLGVLTEIAIKLLILTGQRRSEVVGAEWRHVDLKKKIWHLPMTKNGKPHDVPLSDLAVELFLRLKGYGLDDKRCFPIDEKSLTRAIARKQDDFAIPKWVVHDLRRSFITGSVALGLPIHIVELSVNHELPDMLRVYVAGQNNEKLFEQKRAVMDAWAEHIAALIQDKPVALSREDLKAKANELWLLYHKNEPASRCAVTLVERLSEYTDRPPTALTLQKWIGAWRKVV
ncbi:tyrosine-type recombinase/integrase [Neiella sp. HB171785]|uniref:Tyrosine-type recombinase/integrase n=1 Tax=Neiella litorisoli TaxID=2771431 RepID=A0A8J6UL76_9GAMM|nr:site-specific integrase [Neiella litorisoli]MBD1388425.1 tyrosine-type recombinase/integrase [Neiella litorisoli]